MLTDPIADFINRLQNASAIGKTSVSAPFSQMKLAVAELLVRQGYLEEVEAKSKKGPALMVKLAYGARGPAISGVKRISKPSRRVYMGSKDLRPVKRGHGLLVLSTPQGILSGKDARAQKVGGEALFEIW